MERKCLYCNELFEVTRRNKQYCNRNCKEKGYSYLSGVKITTTEAIVSLANILKPLVNNNNVGSTILEIKGNKIIIDSKYSNCLNNVYIYLNKGYARTNYKGIAVLIHRLLYYLETGSMSSKTNPIDHINRIKLDNRLCNLRLTTCSINSSNCLHKNHTGHKGVYKNFNSYIAQVWMNGKNKHLGRFPTIEEAIKCREEFMKSLS